MFSSAVFVLEQLLKIQKKAVPCRILPLPDSVELNLQRLRD